VLRYADFKADAPGTLQTALAHVGLRRSREGCHIALDIAWEERAAHRFNKGTSGRGRDYFSAGQHAQIARLLSHYRILDGWREQLL
jgi:hypothetical protein